MSDLKKTETMIPTENMNEVEEVMDFLEGLEKEEKKDFLVFMQGIRFAKSTKSA